MPQPRYKWIKLQSNFFGQKEIKKLRQIAGGETFTIIYLKMQLLSLKNDGIIVFENICENFTEELALELDEEVNNVQVTLNYLSKVGLIEEIASDEYLLPEAVRNIGSESASAERMRRLRDRKQQSDAPLLPSHCDADVTPSDGEVTEGDADVQNSDAHIRDKSKSKEIDKDIKDNNLHEANSASDTPPFITLTLNDKSEYPIHSYQIAEWTELYPAVDVEQELRNMKGWLIGNPQKRKTKTGILGFVQRWLSKTQNMGGNNRAGIGRPDNSTELPAGNTGRTGPTIGTIL